MNYDRIRRLVSAIEEANDDFDILAFEQQAFPCGGDCIGTYLAANLDFLRDELRDIASDLYTVGREDKEAA